MPYSTITLSVSQRLILTTAAGRGDRMIMPLPSSLRARGASQQSLLTSLLKLTLAAERPTDILSLAWRKDDHGQHYALKLTARGMKALGSTIGSATNQPGKAKPTTKEPVDKSIVAQETKAPAIVSTDASRAPAGKLGQVLVAVGAGQGATIDELISLTGWLPHTTRAALTRLKQRGYPVQLVKQPDRKAYRLGQSTGI